MLDPAGKAPFFDIASMLFKDLYSCKGQEGESQDGDTQQAHRLIEREIQRLAEEFERVEVVWTRR